MRLDLNDVLSQKLDIQAEVEQRPRGRESMTCSSKSKKARRGCSLETTLGQSVGRKSQRSR